MLFIGDQVRFSSEFCRNVGIYTGQIPLARGMITNINKVGNINLATIDWNYKEDVPNRINVLNLEKVPC